MRNRLITSRHFWLQQIMVNHILTCYSWILIFCPLPETMNKSWIMKMIHWKQDLTLCCHRWPLWQCSLCRGSWTWSSCCCWSSSCDHHLLLCLAGRWSNNPDLGETQECWAVGRRSGRTKWRFWWMKMKCMNLCRQLRKRTFTGHLPLKIRLIKLTSAGKAECSRPQSWAWMIWWSRCGTLLSQHCRSHESQHPANK